MHHTSGIGIPLLCTLLWCLPQTAIATESSQFSSPPSPISETETTILNNLRALLQQRYYRKAYELAHQHLEPLEGRETFDWLLGLAALESSQTDEALFIFERLNTLQPHNQRYRYELARCHFQLGNFPQSKQLFTDLSQQTLPDDVRQAVKRYLRQIRRQSRWQRPFWEIHMASAAGYDTNTNTATDEREIDVLNGQFTAILSEEQQSLASGYFRYSGAGRLLQPYSKNHQLELNLSGARKDNTGTDRYDIDTVSSDLEYRYRHGRSQIFIGGFYRFYWLGREGLQSTWQGRSGVNYSPSSYWQHRLALSINGRDNRLNDEQDNWYPQVELESRTVASRLLVSAKLLAAHDLDKEALARNTYGGDLMLGYQPSQQHRTQLLLRYRLLDYNEKQPDSSLFSPGEARTEHMSQVSIQHQYQIWSYISLHGQFSYIRNHSTIPIYQYDRSLVEAGLGVRF